MKQVVISNLYFLIDKTPLYETQDYYDTLTKNRIICLEFINLFFNFRKLPKHIDKFYIVKSKKGLFDLYKKSGSMDVYWNCKYLPKDFDLVNQVDIYVGNRELNCYNLYTGLFKILKDLFENNEEHIKVDVYVEGWK
jgi:hypothetical protein